MTVLDHEWLLMARITVFEGSVAVMPELSEKMMERRHHKEKGRSLRGLDCNPATPGVFEVPNGCRLGIMSIYAEIFSASLQFASCGKQ